ncbi:AmmeMemoRadiSam system protein B [Candidatus Bathyarchaeota archaeon]|nr:AmmeMemoRadiSam system protein B [Candidatus Bathyarchaeota archaeon]
MVKVRRPTQAGVFYQGDAESLKTQIENCFLHAFGPGTLPKTYGMGPRRILGLVCPHAGYPYSGPVAAHAYYELAIDGKPDTMVIFGPNHQGYGTALSIMNEGYWRSPLGDIEIDSQIANQIMRESKIVDVDELAHLREHSIEVQLPFLQYLYGYQFKFVPICFRIQDLFSAMEIGAAVGKVLAGKKAVVIASSDLTHYEPQDVASEKDGLALEAVKALDEKQFFSTIKSKHISACGYGPIVASMTAAKIMGAKKAELLSYRTSGDITGDYSAVVGYAAVCYKKLNATS